MGQRPELERRAVEQMHELQRNDKAIRVVGAGGPSGRAAASPGQTV